MAERGRLAGPRGRRRAAVGAGAAMLIKDDILQKFSMPAEAWKSVGNGVGAPVDMSTGTQNQKHAFSMACMVAG